MNKRAKILIIVALVLLIIWKLFSPSPKSPSSPARVTEQKPFVIIIPSYNNSAYCKKNLASVFDQNYSNYRVIYIDDCSKDDTFEKATHLSEGHPVTLIKNESNKGALANLYNAIHSCQDNEIIVTLDGDDYLAHENVLTKLNQIYADPDVWMTYGNFVNYPDFSQKPVLCEKIPKRVVKTGSYRKYKWVTSHLRTFYAGLFKKIRYDDLQFNGSFFPMGWDLPMMFPMLEMSGEHTRFIKEVLYLYNRSNPINDHKVNLKLQQQCAEYARSLKPYEPLKELR